MSCHGVISIASPAAGDWLIALMPHQGMVTATTHRPRDTGMMAKLVRQANHAMGGEEVVAMMREVVARGDLDDMGEAALPTQITRMKESGVEKCL